MKKELAALISMSIIIIFPQPSLSFTDVGGDFGILWLQEHGKKPNVEEPRNNLWNWGNAPKGFKIFNGTVYPPGHGPLWYYPNYGSDETPIVINSSVAGGLTADYSGLDPWLTAQLSGRPVAFVSEPAGVLF